MIEDLGSTNGTYVNEYRIEDATMLRSGDRFQVGAAHFKFLQERDIENASSTSTSSSSSTTRTATSAATPS